MIRPIVAGCENISADDLERFVDAWRGRDRLKTRLEVGGGSKRRAWMAWKFRCCDIAEYWTPGMEPGHTAPRCPVCDPVGAALQEEDVRRRDAALVELAKRLVKTSAVHTMLVLLDDAQRKGATDQAPPEGGTVGRLRNPDDVLQIEALRRIKGFDLAAAQESSGAAALLYLDDCNPANARLNSIERQEAGTTVVFYIPHVRYFGLGTVPTTRHRDVLACAFNSDHACIGTPRAVRAWDRVSVATLERAQAESSRVLAVPLLARRHREQPAGLWTARFRCHSVGADGLRYLWAEEGFAGEVEGFIASLIDPPIPTPHVSRAR